MSLAVYREGEAPDLVLVLRPEDDPEFPGMWGLPAASVRPGESPLQAARRVGDGKLGAPLAVGSLVGSGSQPRDDYTLHMSLFRATLSGGPPALPAAVEDAGGVTLYAGWRWGRAEELLDAAREGSLCSRLLLEYLVEHLGARPPGGCKMSS